MAESELPPVVVRLARWDDVESFSALRLQWQDEEPSPEFEHRFRGWFDREWPSRWWWVALDDQRPVGMVNLKLFDRMPTAQDTTSRWGYLCTCSSAPRIVSRMLVAPSWALYWQWRRIMTSFASSSALPRSQSRSTSATASLTPTACSPGTRKQPDRAGEVAVVCAKSRPYQQGRFQRLQECVQVAACRVPRTLWSHP